MFGYDEKTRAAQAGLNASDYGACEPARAPLLLMLADRLSRIYEVAGAADDHLRAVSERLFGPAPENVGSGQTQGGPVSAEDQLASRLAMIEAVVERARHRAMNLNERI